MNLIGLRGIGGGLVRLAKRTMLCTGHEEAYEYDTQGSRGAGFYIYIYIYKINKYKIHMWLEHWVWNESFEIHIKVCRQW